MKRLFCPECSRVIEIEAVYTTTAMVNNERRVVKVEHGHSTTINSEIQCACGTYLK